MSASTILVVAGGAVFVWWIVAVLRRDRTPQRDPQRIFDQKQRDALISRCGNQCEHKPLIGRRCTLAPTHMDHVYPWSKGGATTLGNGQALCVHHNLKKSDRAPSRWYIARLERRRKTYFPEGQSPRVVWRAEAGTGRAKMITESHRYRPARR